MDLIPPTFMVERNFAAEKSQLDELNTKLEAATLAIEEFVEENSGDEGALVDAMVDGNITKALATARLKIAKSEDPNSEEMEALTTLIDLYGIEAAVKKEAKQATAMLDEVTLHAYGSLTTDEIMDLVIDSKWGSTVDGRIQAEISGLIQRLIERINVLGERYDSSLESIEADVDELKAAVVRHLAEMGVE